jgi:hypothetical protein
MGDRLQVLLIKATHPHLLVTDNYSDNKHNGKKRIHHILL